MPRLPAPFCPRRLFCAMTTDEGGDVGSLNQDWLGLLSSTSKLSSSIGAHVRRCSDQIRSLSSHPVGGADLIHQIRRETRGTSLGLYIITCAYFFRRRHSEKPSRTACSGTAGPSVSDANRAASAPISAPGSDGYWRECYLRTCSTHHTVYGRGRGVRCRGQTGTVCHANTPSLSTYPQCASHSRCNSHRHGCCLLRELDPSFPRLSLVRLRGCRDCANNVCTTLVYIPTSTRRHTQTPPRARPLHELLSSLKSQRLHQDASRPGKRDHLACRHAAWPSEGLAGASYAGMQVATTSKLRALPTCPQPWTCIACLPRTPPSQNRHQRLRVSPAPRRGAVPKAYFLTCLGCRCTA